MFTLRLAAAGVALLVAGCTSGTMASQHGNASPKPELAGADLTDSWAGPPPIVLTDTSAARLSLSLRLDVGGFDSTTRDKTEISVMFTSAGRLVRLRGDERITCNGIVVSLHGTTFDL